MRLCRCTFIKVLKGYLTSRSVPINLYFTMNKEPMMFNAEYLYVRQLFSSLALLFLQQGECLSAHLACIFKILTINIYPYAHIRNRCYCKEMLDLRNYGLSTEQSEFIK